jgi:hypothetical protein
MLFSNLKAVSNSYHPYKQADLINESSEKIKLLLKSLNEFDLKGLYKSISSPYGNSKKLFYELSKNRITKCINNIDKNAPYYTAVKSKLYNYNVTYTNNFFINSTYKEVKKDLGYSYYICKETYDIKKLKVSIYAILKKDNKDNVLFNIRINGKDVNVKFIKFANHIYISDNNEELYTYIKQMK